MWHEERVWVHVRPRGGRAAYSPEGRVRVSLGGGQRGGGGVWGWGSPRLASITSLCATHAEHSGVAGGTRPHVGRGAALRGGAVGAPLRAKGGNNPKAASIRPNPPNGAVSGAGGDAHPPPPSPFAPTEYARPTPPPHSGYHRYQLRLYEQPEGGRIRLGPEERISAGEEQPSPGGIAWGAASVRPSVRPESAEWEWPRRDDVVWCGGMSSGCRGGMSTHWGWGSPKGGMGIRGGGSEAVKLGSGFTRASPTDRPTDGGSFVTLIGIRDGDVTKGLLKGP